MNKYEKEARFLHTLGSNCSNSLYNAFKEDYNLKSDIPKPRSIDGICGTVLTTKQVLKELDKEEYIKEYEQKFIKEFGYIKCIDLMKNSRKCNDYIRFSASYISKKIIDK